MRRLNECSGDRRIRAEILNSESVFLNAYLSGASRDGTFNALHRTWRIAQSDIGWLENLQVVLDALGARGWIYQEGRRSVWVLETTYAIQPIPDLRVARARVAFVRGYFDAEGGVPRRTGARFYIQFVQKNQIDLARLKGILESLSIECGRLHNPSRDVDPDYWRFYVLAASHVRFMKRVSSWHLRKRSLLDAKSESLPRRRESDDR